MPSIVIRESDGKTRVLGNEGFKYEEILQRNIADIPRLIPLEAVTDEAVEHLTIGSEWSAGAGAADVVLLGTDAILTVVETKLKRNPEARREVIAQVLEYGAYLSELTISDISWRADDFLRTEKAAIEYRNKTLNETLALFLADSEESIESFLRRVEDNLRRVILRLIVAVDEVGEQAQKIITFVNSFSSFDLYLLQITAYRDGNRQIFVPSLHGYARKITTTTERIQWDWDKYQSELGWTEEEKELAKSLNDKIVRLTKKWNPEYRFKGGWTNFYFGGRKSPCGVMRSRIRGVELWFRLSANPELPLPARVNKRKTRDYLYLNGALRDLTDQQITNHVKLALDQITAESDA